MNSKVKEDIPFTILMSLYYKENSHYLEQAFESIFNQTKRANQVVLIEDGPLTPELYSVVNDFKERYPELEVIPLSQNRGLGEALNEGLKHCSYELVARMDTDDICKPSRFEHQISFLQNHLEIDLIGSWVDEFEGDTAHVTSVRKVPETPEEIYQYCKSRCPVNHPTVMYRKQAVQAVGGYLTKYFPEDYFLWIRMLMNGAKFYNLQESLVFFRYSPDTIKKRGGWKYAIGEIHIQKMIYNLGFITLSLFLKNSIIRFVIRIIPLSLRVWVYNSFLRNKKI